MNSVDIIYSMNVLRTTYMSISVHRPITYVYVGVLSMVNLIMCYTRAMNGGGDSLWSVTGFVHLAEVGWDNWYGIYSNHYHGKDKCKCVRPECLRYLNVVPCRKPS